MPNHLEYSRENIVSGLKEAGQQQPNEISIGLVALYLSAITHPGLVLDRYCNHLKKMCEMVADRHDELLKAGADDDVLTQVAALKHVVVDHFGYTGAEENYDDLQNADLVRVVDRRMGMPIALGVLYIHIAEHMGWDLKGISFPAHFLMRMERDHQRVICDPFDSCKILQAHDLRGLIKKYIGDNAELSAKYYEEVDHREVLLRLQNNIKFRQIESEDYAEALRTVDTMRWIAPQDYRLLLDAGVLYARTGQPELAEQVLEEYIEKAPTEKDRYDAMLILEHVREILGR